MRKYGPTKSLVTRPANINTRRYRRPTIPLFFPAPFGAKVTRGWRVARSFLSSIFRNKHIHGSRAVSLRNEISHYDPLPSPASLLSSRSNVPNTRLRRRDSFCRPSAAFLLQLTSRFIVHAIFSQMRPSKGHHPVVTYSHRREAPKSARSRRRFRRKGP